MVGLGHQSAVQDPAPARQVEISSETSWEAPDPVWWLAHGYAVVNADIRGAGTSDGAGR
ncbi:X-Pro dipeptidyl-peptidase family protein [Mycobacterium ulcerans str. Harvey]|uniref:X-Pro dipeptidyl-peptidase family protein n=1 Tax=Mycobacterium ulcerans str. Harvey TaxID=1299332 RepID=A0ABN0R7X4_MYCUL|nr:X-Pro dipeptidyl-peptidase family protein [Mycobacterium ulcerans str. Harvey]